jgi:hypothetical protein
MLLLQPVVSNAASNRRRKGQGVMADRKPFIGDIKADEQLNKLLESSRRIVMTDDDLREQKISFAYGNAPASAKDITKDSVRKASQHILLKG